jgi:hypothetical protein
VHRHQHQQQTLLSLSLSAPFFQARPVNRIGVAEYNIEEEEEEEEEEEAEGKDGELGEMQKENAPFIFSSASAVPYHMKRRLQK